jgi:hypothetical protein
LIGAGPTYRGHNHKAIAERCCQINNQLELFGQNATKFSDSNIVCKVVYRALEDLSKVNAVQKVGVDTHTEVEIVNVIEDVSSSLDTVYKLKKNQQNKYGKQNNLRNNEDKPNGNGDATPKDKGGGRPKNMCRVPC